MKRFQVTVNGNMYHVEVEELHGGQSFVKQSAPVQPIANAQPQITPAAPAVAPVETAAPAPVATASGEVGAHKIVAPMQGKIVGIKVAVGDSVKKDDVLFVLEAMKMENEIVSPVAGTVASVNVTMGLIVNTSELCISLN